MPANFIKSIEEFEDENGVRFVVSKIRSKNKKNLLKSMMIDGIEIVSEAALVAYTWKSNFHPALPLMVSAMCAVSVTDLYRNVRKYIRKLPRLQRDRLRLKWYLATGAITYFTTIHAFSEALKCNNKVWIPCLLAAASGYQLAVTSVTKLGRTVLNRSPFMKCCQLLFGPTLIGCAAYYLLNFRQHEEWLLCLPMIALALVANHITFAGYRRVESKNEPRWLLFKGLELLVGGCLLLINGSVLVIYAANNQFHPLFITVVTMIINGITDITNSLESFQGCFEMDAPVFYCICGMIGGPIVFLSACLSIRCIGHPIMQLPVFLITVGTGIALLGISVLDLDVLVPRPVFKRYCRRVLGPVMTLYSSMVAAYFGYHMGWRFSLVMMPFIPAGIHTTYEGFRRRNQPR